jgi:tetratricopeptide (TPR) repeat protein
MRSLIFICCSLFLYSVSNAQSDSIYHSLIAKASLSHLQKDYKSAITYYENAFQIKQPDALTSYKAAGIYSLDGNADKAFQFLQLSLSSGWTEAHWLSFDEYFDYLRNCYPEKWTRVEEQAFINESQYEKTLELASLRKEINSRKKMTLITTRTFSILSIVQNYTLQEESFIKRMTSTMPHLLFWVG